MAGEGGAEIDLYDNIDEDFVQECSDLTELYDDVIAPSTSEAAITAPSVVLSKPSLNNLGLHNGRRIATYVGNLTWWTTDQDLLEAANKLGINDVIEIKFHENRQNGQSKGFCAMVFGSEQSVRVAMDKMPKTEIHGQKPVVTHCTKQNLSVFEKASGGDSQQTSRARSDESSGKSSGLSAGSVNSSTSRAPPLMATPTMPASLGFSLRNNSSLMGQATPNLRQMAGALPNTLQQALATQTLQAGLSGGGHMGQLTLNLPTVSGVLMTPSIPPPPLPGNTSSLLPTAFNLPNTISTSLTSGTAQVNHNFFSQAIHAQGALPTPVPAPASLLSLNTSNSQASVRSQFDNYGRPVIHTYTPSSTGKLSESDFEDILQRNKTVSSSAINRAVQDAAGGDYASAIETLVTAISLIKQSKIASDDRCRILINSLQDTLHGIESKSYGTNNPGIQLIKEDPYQLSKKAVVDAAVVRTVIVAAMTGWTNIAAAMPLVVEDIATEEIGLALVIAMIVVDILEIEQLGVILVTMAHSPQCRCPVERACLPVFPFLQLAILDKGTAAVVQLPAPTVIVILVIGTDSSFLRFVSLFR
ncbi:cleavage and polyadenylation specificity factor subunit 6/7 [Paragonimus westermani]|uniref:Cleavage and polyadenylation specificity factor subunit 6 n=1 Tax=Paragonimus westermani TaxID=34504 RepID=A0A5J4NZ24_9TREM|nr:cleavage and polyadenylation specificity factor subunit 6/7 [Paragonimus westermani]